MRILYVVHQFLPEFGAGTEMVTLRLAKAAQRLGFHAEVLTVSLRPEADWSARGDEFRAGVVEGVPVTGLVNPAPTTFGELGFQSDPELRRRIDAFLDGRPAFDVAHVVHTLRMTEAAEALRARRTPYLATLTDFFTLCHRVNLIRTSGELCAGPRGGKACQRHCPAPGLPRDAYAARLERLRQVLENAFAVVAVSQHVADRFASEHPDLPVTVIPNGVDLLKFGAPAPRDLADPLTFGYLGTVSEAKGALRLAQAFAAAGLTGARLRLVGPCDDPTLAASLQGLAATADIRLEAAAAPRDVPKTLAGFDVLCVPSQVPESFSLALHEGFAAGLPALVSDLGNIADVVGRHGCGAVVPAADTGAWTQALRDAAANPARLRDWAAAAPLPLRVEEETFLYAELYRAGARTLAR